MSKGYRRQLIDIEALKVYALEHPGMTSTKLIIVSGLSVSESSICNYIRREKERDGKLTNITALIHQKAHHFLSNDGNDIVVFGLASSIVFLGQTTLIQGDGTFTCVVLPFTNSTFFTRCSEMASRTPSSTEGNAKMGVFFEITGGFAYYRLGFRNIPPVLCKSRGICLLSACFAEYPGD